MLHKSGAVALPISRRYFRSSLLSSLSRGPEGVKAKNKKTSPFPIILSMASSGGDSDHFVEEEEEEEEEDEEEEEEESLEDEDFLAALDEDLELLDEQFFPTVEMADLEEAMLGFDPEYVPPPPHYLLEANNPDPDPVVRGRRGPRRARRLRVQDEEEGEDDSEVVIFDAPPPASAAVARDFAACRWDGNEEDVGCSGRLSGTDVDYSSSSSAPSCSICMDRWMPDGAHRVCCIPCGHVYGRSCLEKWVERCGRSSVKCPQCNRKFRDKQIINLYAPQIAVASEDLEKEVRSLREKNESLTVEKKLLFEELHKHKIHIIELENSERHKRACVDHVSSGVAPTRSSDHCYESQKSLLQNFAESDFVSQNHIKGGSLQCGFVLKVELEVDEARVLDTDALNQIVVISRATLGLGGGHVLTKISMLIPHEMENVFLPPNIGAIRDIHIAPYSTILPGRLALLASLGKKLSLFSMESNNIVLKYDLPSPAWSCSWDFNNPNLIYAGLQNGMMLVFDIRQTSEPLRSNKGLSGYPVHTIHSLSNNNVDNSRTLFSASSVGPCLWNGSSTGERPFLIPELERHGVCISLASGRTGDDVVATFRPKVEISSENPASQSHSPIVTEPGRVGSHLLLRRSMDNCYHKYQSTAGSVSELRMSRSVIVPMEGNNLFACGDEVFRGVRLHYMPSLQVVRRLKPHQHPILDIKYSRSTGPGMLTCISKSKLQLFACSEF